MQTASHLVLKDSEKSKVHQTIITPHFLKRHTPSKYKQKNADAKIPLFCPAHPGMYNIDINIYIKKFVIMMH